MPYLTNNILKQSKHNNGWYKQQLEILSIPFPPPKDWKRNVINKIYSQNTINQFIHYIPSPNTKIDDKKTKMTMEQIILGMSGSGGYKKKQIEILGLTWPLEKGWKKTVIDKYYPKIDIERFVNYNKLPPSITEFLNSCTETINNENIEPDIIVYTDGSCSNNGFPNAMAGIGIYFNENDSKNVSRRVVGKQSNNTAELTAIIETLHILQSDIKQGKIIHIYSDSKYAIRCCTEYGEKCQLNKWEKNIPNKDLVKQAYQLKKQYDNVELIHIKAHTNNTDIHSLGNDGADRLANHAIGLETCPYNSKL